MAQALTDIGFANHSPSSQFIQLSFTETQDDEVTFYSERPQSPRMQPCSQCQFWTTASRYESSKPQKVIIVANAVNNCEVNFRTSVEIWPYTNLLIKSSF